MLWLHLCRLTQDLGHCSGFTYGFLNLILFILQTISGYAFLSEVSGGVSISSLAFGISNVLFGVIVFIQCNVAQHAINQVSFNQQAFFLVYFTGKYCSIPQITLISLIIWLAQSSHNYMNISKIKYKLILNHFWERSNLISRMERIENEVMNAAMP